MVTEAERNTPDDELIAAMREYLAYNAETGEITWRLSPARCVKVGDVAGGDDGLGYLKFKFRGRSHRAHRVAWALAHGRWPEKGIDHINRIRSDNRLANLRECDQFENLQNQSRAGQGSNHLKGAVFHRRIGRFQSRIQKNNKMLHLGYYDTEEEAHAAYLAAKRRLHTFNPEITT